LLAKTEAAETSFISTLTRSPASAKVEHPAGRGRRNADAVLLQAIGPRCGAGPRCVIAIGRTSAQRIGVDRARPAVTYPDAVHRLHLRSVTSLAPRTCRCRP
jgi:hypothetical protein